MNNNSGMKITASLFVLLGFLFLTACKGEIEMTFDPMKTPSLKVGTPHYSPGGGTYSSPQTVEITTDVDDAVIIYAFDDTPTCSSGTVYSAPLDISDDTVLRAIACKDGYVDSEIAEAEYIIEENDLPVSGLAAYYPFNSSALDETGNGNDGTVYGAVLATDRFGNTNSAYSFDGVDDYISFATPAELTGASAITFSLWACSEMGASSEAFLLAINEPELGLVIYSGMLGAVQGDSADVYGAVAAGWVHYVTIWDGTEILLYEDGRLQASISTIAVDFNDLGMPPASLVTVYALGGHFTGSIDDVRVYNRALDSGEVAALYDERDQGPIVALPQFSLAEGSFESSVSVTISTATPGAAILYSVNSAAPTCSSGTEYSSPITVTETSTIRAIACRDGFSDSKVASAVYTITPVPVASAPEFDPPGGIYPTGQTVAITSDTTSAYVRYTTDGSIPTCSAGTLYSGPVAVSDSSLIKAIACGESIDPSDATEAQYQFYTIESPDATGGVGQYGSLGIDQNGRAHISYYDNTNGDLKYATNESGAWVLESVDTYGDVGKYTSLDIDDSGYVHISYIDSDYDSLMYTSNKDVTWFWGPLSNDAAGQNSIRIDDTGDFHIGFFDYIDEDLRYINGHYNTGGGLFSTYYTDSAGTVGEYSSLVLDGSGHGHISYYDRTNSNLKYAVDTNGDGYMSTYTVDSAGDVGMYTSIAVDSDGHAHISYFDTDNASLKYATNESGSWQNTTIENGAGANGTSIAVDASGAAHISYYDLSNWDLKYATNKSGSWSTHTLDTTGAVGTFSSLALDSTGSVHISYYDSTNQDLKYLSFNPVVYAAGVPAFDATPGTYYSQQTVAIETSTSGASIYYTTNDSTPNCTGTGTYYSGALAISTSTTVKAIACRSSMRPSDIAVGEYVITAAAPAFDPTPGTYATEQTVTIETTTPAASLYYTTDDSTPDCAGTGTPYSGYLTVSATTTIKAIACGTGIEDSSVSVGDFIIGGITADGLVAWYPFSGNVNDESSNSNDGTVYGAVLTTDRFGNTNSAYSFDGVDDYIDLGSSFTQSPADLTYAAWIKTTYDVPSGGSRVIISRKDAMLTDSCMTLLVNENDYASIGINSHQHYTTWPVYSTAINDGRWHFVTATKNGDTLTVYVDGITGGTFDDSLSISSTSPFYIGKDKVWEDLSVETHFYGIIDDVRIYESALTSEDIQTLYREGISGEAVALTVDGGWASGSISSAGVEKWYAFTASSGSGYRIWWDDGYQGSGSYNLDVKVTAYHGDFSSAYFTNIDSGYTTVQNITATADETVYIKVISYGSGTPVTCAVEVTSN